MLSEESRMLDLCIRKDLRKNKVCIEKYCSDTARRFTVVTLSARIRLSVTLRSFRCLTQLPLAQGGDPGTGRSKHMDAGQESWACDLLIVEPWVASFVPGASGSSSVKQPGYTHQKAV